MTINSTEWMAAVPAVISAAAAIIGGYVALVVARFRAEWERGRREDQEALKGWINGSFMRSAEVRAELTHIDQRLERTEETISNLHTYTHDSVHDLKGHIEAIQKFGCAQREAHS